MLTPENKEQWLSQASTLSQRELEKEIVKVQPKPQIAERITPVSEGRSELRLAIHEELERKLRRIQDLISQKTKKAASLEEALLEAVTQYLKRNDPVERAQRLCPNTAPKEQAPGRRPIAAAIKHAVNGRDSGKCTYIQPNGRQCSSTRWTAFHHIKRVSSGGTNHVQNLTTLCATHHRLAHSSIKMDPAKVNSRSCGEIIKSETACSHLTFTANSTDQHRHSFERGF
ncbi:MAG: HNH endonuclease [Deltaproteobacteria bacterium]|nr:HNH endonuclease [Deltaproteobacteria bacterium]